MSLIVLCDTHLSLSLNKPMDIFGSRWHNFEEKLRHRWNERVTDADTVVIGGDISWAMSLNEAKEDFSFINSLPGKKIFVRGNHDFWWDSLKKMKHFLDSNSFDTISFLQNDAQEVGGIAICGTRGWFADAKSAPPGTDYEKLSLREAQRLEMSIQSAEKNMPGAEINVFLHLPPIFGDCICEPICSVLSRYEVKRCFYGHIHGLYEIPQITCYNGVSYILTSADYLDFTPYRVD